MRISKIKVSSEFTSKVNLKAINLTQKTLGSTVALVGKNGAGKSRVLKFVENYLQSISVENLLEDHITFLPKGIFNENLAIQLTNAKNLYIKSKVANIDATARNQIIANYKAIAAEHLNRLKQLGANYVKVVDNDDLKQIKATLTDNLTFEQILSNTHLNLKPNQQSPKIINEFTAFNSQNTIQFFNKLSTELVTDEFNLYLDNRDNPAAIQAEMAKKESHIRFSKFKHYVKRFLGREFSYKSKTTGTTLSSILYFNGQPFDINLLSPGQKTLFAYAILFFVIDTNSQTNIKDSIIIIDEPEKHLHPEAQLLLINALKDIVSKSGQLWIATHSINILANLDHDEIIMLKNDEIIPPSRTTPGNSLNELMGLDGHIDELATFINSTSEWAYSNFMAQCFKEPTVVFGNDPNDPQYKLFKDFISTRQQITLLDFGAGKGRMGFTLSEDSLTSRNIQYCAYEPDTENLELLRKVPNLHELYQDVSDIPDEKFDCILMCNVLHEINPRMWVEIFNEIKIKLKLNGYLIIIEDKFLPKGESAHQFGYLILGIDQLRLLFNSYLSDSSDQILECTLTESKYKERILFAATPQYQIRPTETSVIQAIMSLEESSFINLKSIRNHDKDINQGRLYANQTQLYINAKIALEELTK